jgi:hypothetical protein
MARFFLLTFFIIATFVKFAYSQNFNGTLTTAVLNGWGFYSNATAVNIEKRGIIAIQDNTFNGFSNLKQLLMGNNKLSSIGVNTFSGLTNLETLDLVNNTVSSIGPNCFQNLGKLLVLDLTNNALMTVNSSIFTGRCFSYIMVNIRDLFIFLIN